MSDRDREKWNQRYREGSYNRNNPVTLVEQWLPVLPAGRALDVACGAGRNALLLAQAGCQVDAIDISSEGLALAQQEARSRGLKINWIEHDLDEPWRFAADYDVILVMWYVNLELLAELCACLAPGGYLLCEEHMRTDQDVIGPTSSDYRVAPGALREAVSGVDIVLYEEAVTAISEEQKVASARLVARKLPARD